MFENKNKKNAVANNVIILIAASTVAPYVVRTVGLEKTVGLAVGLAFVIAAGVCITIAAAIIAAVVWRFGQIAVTLWNISFGTCGDDCATFGLISGMIYEEERKRNPLLATGIYLAWGIFFGLIAGVLWK